MRERAIKYFEQGYNCSQCLLKAGEQKYAISVSENCYQMLSGINTGLGVGGICSVLIAGVLLFGIIFDEQTTKRLRMQLLSEFNEHYGSINCDSLRKKRANGCCDNIVGAAADLIDDIICGELQSNFKD